MAKNNQNSYLNLFSTEAIRGEWIHWRINWILCPVVFLFCYSTYTFQDNKVAGMAGMIFAFVNLIYNILLGYIIPRVKNISKLSYITVTYTILALNVYNFLDLQNNSNLLPATSATLLIYPILILLSAFRINRNLVLYSTVLSIISMNGLYLYSYMFLQMDVIKIGLSTDYLSQVYRTIYLVLTGYMISNLPKTVIRFLKKQENLIQEKEFHKTKAETDILTKLYNRFFLETNFNNIVGKYGYSNNYALLFIDLDGFKKLNDTYGHDCGDFILKSVAKDLVDCVRDDDFVVRLGGDEIVILYRIHGDYNYVKDFAERILKTICVYRLYNNQKVWVGASIGVAIYPKDGETLEILLEHGDESMYRVKNSEKSGINYFSI